MGKRIAIKIDVIRLKTWAFLGEPMLKKFDYFTFATLVNLP
jgi:hypothetical protein